MTVASAGGASLDTRVIRLPSTSTTAFSTTRSPSHNRPNLIAVVWAVASAADTSTATMSTPAPRAPCASWYQALAPPAAPAPGQRVPIHLAEMRARQRRRRKMTSRGYLYGSSRDLAKSFNAAARTAEAVIGDDEGAGLDQPIGVRDADDRDLAHADVLQQAVLELPGRQPFAAHFQHVVAAAAIDEGAVGVLAQHVARHVPLAAKGVHRVRAAVASNRSRASRLFTQSAPTSPSGTSTPSFVAQLHLEAVDRRAERARHDRARPVGQEDVPHLGGAEPIQQLDAEGLRPARVAARAAAPRRRRSTSRSDSRSCSWASGCATICCTIVGTLISTVGRCRAIMGEEAFRRAALRKEHARRADGEREEQVRAGARSRKTVSGPTIVMSSRRQCRARPGRSSSVVFTNDRLVCTTAFGRPVVPPLKSQIAGVVGMGRERREIRRRQCQAVLKVRIVDVEEPRRAPARAGRCSKAGR